MKRVYTNLCQGMTSALLLKNILVWQNILYFIDGPHILFERQQKQCCIEGISLHERTQKRTHVNKWVNEDDDEIQEHW